MGPWEDALADKWCPFAIGVLERVSEDDDE
jgi:hypothetical protein